MSVLLQITLEEVNPWVVVAVAGMAAFYLLVIRPRMRRGRDPLKDRSGSIPLAQQRSVEREMSSLLVELSEMSRQITAQLDTRSAKLEALIEEADEKIAELRKAAGEAGASNGREPSKPDSDDPTDRIDPRHAEIYALADQGRSPHQIAQTLDRPNGEVELILALRGREN